MNQQNEAQQGQMEQQPERNAHKALSRRKFLTQASVVSLPVLMSLKSGDAWGCVTLDCAGGEGNWSGTASAVSSLKKRETGDKNAKINPIFDSVDRIKLVVEKDIRTSSFLWSHLRTFRYRKGNNNFPLVYKKYKTNLTDLTPADITAWADECVRLSNGNAVYTGSNTAASVTTLPSILIKPISYAGKVIHEKTMMDSFFKDIPLMKKSLASCLSSGNNFEKYVTAAFVGSLWQKAEIWSTPYAPKSGHKSDCYPEISVLMAAFRNVLANAARNGISQEVALADMGNMFKAYTK